MRNYIDLGCGWFLCSEENPPVNYVFDSTAIHPDHHFGPAAWNRSEGPISGLTLLEMRSTAEGDWGQTGPEEWKWILPGGEELDDAPPNWPRRVIFRAGSAEYALGDLDGLVLLNESELIELVRGITAQMPKRKLQTASSKTRMERMRALVPQAFD